MRKVEVIKWNGLWDTERIKNLINLIIEGAEKEGGVVVSTNLVAAPSGMLVEYCYIIEFDFPNKEKAQMTYLVAYEYTVNGCIEL